MGRTKELLDELHITEEDIMNELTSRNDDDYQYQKWIFLYGRASLPQLR